MKSYYRIIALTCLLNSGCVIDHDTVPYSIKRSHDSLIIDNKVKNVKFVLYQELPDYVREYHYYNDGGKSLYVYCDNLILNYSLDSNKVSNGFIFKNYSSINEDSVIIEKINEKYIHIKTVAHDYILNQSLTKWYDLNTVLNDTNVRYLPESKIKRTGSVLAIDFILKDGKIINKIINVDTLKLKDIQEHWKALKE